jgi:hypothetical protein
MVAEGLQMTSRTSLGKHLSIGRIKIRDAGQYSAAPSDAEKNG